MVAGGGQSGAESTFVNMIQQILAIGSKGPEYRGTAADVAHAGRENNAQTCARLRWLGRRSDTGGRLATFRNAR
jgi:hypothetical protein